jgi:brefeldin A-resistance guanine nucleotide exchange factor 1
VIVRSNSFQFVVNLPTFFFCFVVELLDVLSMDPSTIIRPFLELIRHEHTSSPMTEASLKAVQSFLNNWQWDQAIAHHATISDTISDIVDAVTQCRWRETDPESDHNALMMVIQVLHTVVHCECSRLLSDHSMWRVVESLYGLSRTPHNDVRKSTGIIPPHTHTSSD